MEPDCSTNLPEIKPPPPVVKVIEEHRFVKEGNTHYIRSARDSLKPVFPKVPDYPEADVIRAPHIFSNALIRFGTAYRINAQNRQPLLFGRVGVYIRYLSGLMYQGDDILVGIIKPCSIKICFPQPYFQFEDKSGFLWLINFDYNDDGVEVYTQCHRARSDYQHQREAATLADKDREIVALKRKVSELQDALMDGYGSFREGASKLARFVERPPQPEPDNFQK